MEPLPLLRCGSGLGRVVVPPLAELKGLVPPPRSVPVDWGRGLRPPPMPTNSATRAAEWREGCVNRGNWGEHVANIGQRELWVHG